MKIALIEPKAADINTYTDWMADLPLLGLPYIGAVLKKKGHSVVILNENITKFSISELGQYDAIGLSLMTSTAPRGYAIAKKYKELYPKRKVVIGGPHATFLPEEAAKFADHVITREAELVIADVMENGGEKIIQGKPIENLDDLPFPDISLIKGYKVSGRLTPISTSRGCPFACDFCTVSPMFGRRYRFRSTKNVMEELSRYKKHNYVFFYDDNFTANRDRTKELLEEMITNKITPPWIAQVRADIHKDEELVKLMNKANCYALCIGFESVYDKTLKEYKKGTSVRDMKECIKVLHKNNIKIHGMFLSEGYYDYNKLGIDTLQLTVPIPLPGSKLFEKIKESGKFFSERNPLKNPVWWKYFDGGHVVHFTEGLSPREIQEQTLRSLKKFYSGWNCFKQLVKLKWEIFTLRVIGNRSVAQWKRSNKKFMESLKTT